MALHLYTLIITLFLQLSTGFGLSQFKPEMKVVGGYQALPGQFPYQVSLRMATSYGSTSGHFCGGTIINERHIVTAAHCLYRKNPEDMYIVAGTVRLSEFGQQRRVQSYSYHNLYSDGSFKYDVGIIRLYTALEIDNQTVKEIPIELSTPLAGTMCTVSGWGQTQENKSSITNLLMAVDVPIADWSSCVRNYSKLGDVVPEAGMLCAGFPSGGKDACSGDSGGPLVCQGNLVGIVSWGAGCAEKNLPGVYTDVAYFQTWIRTNSATIITVEYRGFYVFIVLGYICLYLIRVG
ncbi:hypothetical protein J6590_002164 [Homalodisca vitripennis]|nr:hypothetical protein J6590_002164 [Homalodisca vitripennis]